MTILNQEKYDIKLCVNNMPHMTVGLIRKILEKYTDDVSVCISVDTNDQEQVDKRIHCYDFVDTVAIGDHVRQSISELIICVTGETN